MSTLLRNPDMGPIVGHTTDTTTRLWIRAAGGEGRTVGVAARFHGGALIPGSARYFRLHRKHDRTGTVDFDGLTPESSQDIRMGSLHLDTPPLDDDASDQVVFAGLPDPEVWGQQLAALDPERSRASFLTLPTAASTLAFLFGSCRYNLPSPLDGFADEVFGAMAEMLANPGWPQLQLMVGDQIYADPAGKFIPILAVDTEEGYHARYRDAFGTPNLRNLMRQLPTYMVLDDHEIADNWVANVGDPRQLAAAMLAYRSYQWVHSPRSFGESLFYAFEASGFPFFALDERTRRIVGPSAERSHLLGYPGTPANPAQIERFCAWLVAEQAAKGDKPKFVMSGTVFAPNEQNPSPDGWAAFPATRRRILQTILDHGVQNVVFLCGDIHCSGVAELRFDVGGAPSPIRAFSLTSSAFYWPYPTGDQFGHVTDSAAQGDTFDVGLDAGGLARTMDYTAGPFIEANNFSRVDLDWNTKTLLVQVFGTDGALLQSKRLRLA